MSEMRENKTKQARVLFSECRCLKGWLRKSLVGGDPWETEVIVTGLEERGPGREGGISDSPWAWAAPSCARALGRCVFRMNAAPSGRPSAPLPSPSSAPPDGLCILLASLLPLVSPHWSPGRDTCLPAALPAAAWVPETCSAPGRRPAGRCGGSKSRDLSSFLLTYALNRVQYRGS